MTMTQVIAISAVIIANLGTIIALYLQLDRKIDYITDKIMDIHGRLCVVEEKNKGK